MKFGLVALSPSPYIMSLSHKPSLESIAYLIQNLSPQSQNTQIADLDDKSYHRVLEAIFSHVLQEEKPALYKPKSQKGAALRLEKCADAVKVTVSRGLPKFGRKTLHAVIDHITQTLPGPNNDFVQPLLQGYVKALTELLSRQAHVESLACKDGGHWDACVDFLLDLGHRILPEEADRVSSSYRASPAPGAIPLRSSSSMVKTASQKRSGPNEGGTLRDVLEGLYHLVRASNAPITRQSSQIAELVLRILNVKHFSLGSIQTVSFAILNSLFGAIQADKLDESQSLMKKIVPLMVFWWRADKVSQDELIRSLRNEMLKAILHMHLHIEKLAIHLEDENFTRDLEDLADTFWVEYSKRGEPFRLQLVDITFSLSVLPEYSLRTHLFGLRPHNVEGESYWALVQALARLESILINCNNRTQDHVDELELSRKRRRIRESSSRVRLKLRSKEVGVRRTAIQLIPFILASNSLRIDDTIDFLEDLTTLAGDKDPLTASWALIACASCALKVGETKEITDTWRQLWHIASRAVCLPSTSRAACCLLHTLLLANHLPYHEISEEINSIVTTADVNGPAILSDTSLALMLYLFHIRNMRSPNASQATCSHVIRWVFLRWNPSEHAYASFHGVHVQAPDLVNLLRACCGLTPLTLGMKIPVYGGSLGEVWKAQEQMNSINEYLLLLEPSGMSPPGAGSDAEQILPPLADASSFFTSKKLILELLYPKLEDLKELSISWTKRSNEGGTQISLERFQSLLMAVVASSLLAPELDSLNTRQSSALFPVLVELTEKSLASAMDSVEPLAFIDLTLRLVRPCIPELVRSNLERFQAEHASLAIIFSKIFQSLKRHDSLQSSAENVDLMDIDPDFNSQASRASTSSAPSAVPRLYSQLSTHRGAYYLDTRKRLSLIHTLCEHREQIGLVPDPFVDELLDLPDEDLLSCQRLVVDLIKSDLVISPESATSLINRLGDIVSHFEYRCCEVALSTCIEVISGLYNVWHHDNQELCQDVSDLYRHFTNICLPNNMFSSQVQISMAAFLFNLLRQDHEYGTNIRANSCRTSLLYILMSGPMSVKSYIGNRIAEIFDLYILKLHDEVFVDVLDSLPKDPDNVAGIAFRLLVLSKIACRWSTLLRRCTYHIFETPGKVSLAADYATRCCASISKELDLKSPRELFHLFSRQLLYTWLENDSLEDIPFSIFGFSSLEQLLSSTQAEAVGLMVMRGQEEMTSYLAKTIGITISELIRRNFSTTMAYSMMYGHHSGDEDAKDDTYIEEKLGNKVLMESKYNHFVDIIALFFDVIDQDSPIEKAFMKQRDLTYAGEIMTAIKAISHSSADLPPNQQPNFRARYLISETRRLCENMIFDFRDLWTPALVSAIARKLFNSVQPALGSLHACAVLRKVRILISLAGNSALESYVLEMLLNSIQKFIVDAECADDALGMSQYLLAEGAPYLQLVPSFVSGYALSTLASLRVFLESSQSSTTQESLFKATMSKAQNFHKWLTAYLSEYDSSLFTSEGQREAFRSITESAAHIRSSGNAERGTFESKLLLDILKDGGSDVQLLNKSSRELALGLLCNDFSFPNNPTDDIVASEEDAIDLAPEVWKSCGTQNLSSAYLSWAGRVVGRAFSASGEIPTGVIRETRLSTYHDMALDANGSEVGILGILQELTSSPDSKTAGLAEAALRSVVSKATHEEDQSLSLACERRLRESLFLASQWGTYTSPPSEKPGPPSVRDDSSVWKLDISTSEWLPKLGVHLAQSISTSTLLSVLPPLLTEVKGFAEKCFPFLLHLVLHLQVKKQQTVKRSLSEAARIWLASREPTAKNNIKLLLNTFLYLRTQEYPGESCIADRIQWLEIDHASASNAAAHCGMYKTALFLAELVSSETTRSSRRSSALQQTDLSETLLDIFENIDDPDAYYGLPEEASLFKVLARVEYENESSKSLAFRGAQYDSHLRQRDPDTESDAQALVKTLNGLGLSGLSYSLLQTQQNAGSSSSSLESTFRTAQKLEMWNLPAPVASDHHAVVVYKAFQSMHQATDVGLVRSAIYDGFQRSILSLTKQNQNARGLRKHLGAAAVLYELDEATNLSDPGDVENVLARFQARVEWMKRGLYEDVSNILSCRGTTMSMLSQHEHLLKSKISVGNLRQAQVQSMLTSASVFRYYQATQETINISTSLMNLLPSCEAQGLHFDAAVKVEAANSLWDHGEMSTSIRLLQGIEKDSTLKKQMIPVSRTDLLSKIGNQVSVARLEKPQDIQKKYLEPALKELKGNVNGKEAGSVYHQFATFCDGQLQDVASLEDLSRLQNLRKGKSDEVAQLQSLINSTKDSQLRSRYSHVLSKEKQWLSLDEQELRRVEQTRSEFVRLSLENYLLSLIASDEYNNDALRFIALWLERSSEDVTNKAVMRYLQQVPTRKFATLMNQLTSRLQNQDSMFHKLLLDLVYNICVEHPYHGMYQIWSGTKAKAQQKDEVAIQRVRATEKVAQRLASTRSVSDIWLAIDKTSKYYHLLAMEKNANKYKSGVKINLKESTAATNLVNYLNKYRIPPPTMHIELSATKDYSKVPTILKLESSMSIASGVSAPKIITAVGTNGVKYKQLVKGGHDDLRQDAIMEQVFAAVSSLLKLHRATQQRSLGIRTYKVLPLTASSGLIEFVPNTIPLHEFLMPAHERYFPKDLKGSQCRKEIFNVQNRTVETRISTYRKVIDKFHPVMKYFFIEYFGDPDEWFVKRLAYTRSTAAISMLGHVLGLGDRHGHNILLDTKTGEVVHIDLGVAFEAGRILPVPELVPFRLTRDIVDGMGITKTEGVFRRCCEFTLDALREEQYSIMTILDVLRYDPLYTWSISPLRLAKLQKARHDDGGAVDESEQSEAEAKKGKKAGGSELNEPSEADRALEVVRKKLSKTLSVTATVNDLINQAVDECNLAVLYSGWAAYA
uniref:Serine/threonine-protein kinase Tel1 n=1 Tax=Bionectria ochroleuca TaxID=29856 RepID=A0A0B7K0U9_BIOOC